MQIFKEDQIVVPILPYDAWVSTLLAWAAHNESHGRVAETLLKMRKRAWVIKGRRIAQKVVDGCMVCRKAKAKRCQQVMSDLPPERTEPAAPFEFTSVDLFGPYQVKDDVKKRVTLKVWGASQHPVDRGLPDGLSKVHSYQRASKENLVRSGHQFHGSKASLGGNVQIPGRPKQSRLGGDHSQKQDGVDVENSFG